MIDLYTFGTPNGRKASVMLEEVGLPYRVHLIDIMKGDQNDPAYRAVNPNGKIPALQDSEGPEGAAVTVFESGAILIYLAEKTGKFLPAGGAGRYEVLQWLMFQMGGFGPMLGQANHFLKFAKEQVPYAMERYRSEARRLYGVLDGHLAKRTYLAGDYSIADIATYPWALSHTFQQIDLKEFPNVQRWVDEVGARPAVQKGMSVP